MTHRKLLGYGRGCCAVDEYIGQDPNGESSVYPGGLFEEIPLVTALVSEPNPADATHKVSSTSIHCLATKSNQFINPNLFDSVHALIFSATFGLNDLE